jgi:hypothetical protein
MNAILRRQIMESLSDACLDLGFSKRGPFWLRKVSPDVSGAIALPFDQDGYWFVSPSVGVQHHPVARLVAELTDRKFDPVNPATLACNIGYLANPPDYLMFTFPDDRDPFARVPELVEIVRSVAIPWIDRHNDLESFIQDMNNQHISIPHHTRTLQAAMEFLKGNLPLARELLRTGLEEVQGMENVRAQEFRSFASGLIKKLDDRD